MFRKLLLQIIHNQKEIKELLDPKILEKSKKYDALIKDLENIKLPVDKIVSSYDEEGNEILKVFYKPIIEQIHFSESGKISTSEMFKSINILNLTPLKDMEKIQKKIVEVENIKNVK